MIVGLAVGLALGIQAFVVKPYQIPSSSMKPTLDVNQRVLVNRFVYRFTDPSVGDIVVFHPPAGAERGPECGIRSTARGDVDADRQTYDGQTQACPVPTEDQADTNFIKRIVAGPGDTLSIENGQPVVNDEPATEEFIMPCGGGPDCDLPKEITIPPDHYFMMGDNRGASEDSRFWGPVPRDWIIGQAFGTYWPPQKIGPL